MPSSAMNLMLAEDDALLADALTAQLRRAGFAVEHVQRASIELVDLVAAVGDDGDTELAPFRQRADQVERDALRGRGVKVQPVHHRNVDQVVGRETTRER